jgi:prefoldin beta subunit
MVDNSLFLTRQSQSIQMQKSQLEMLIRENELALDALNQTADDTPVYQMFGEIIIRSEKQKLIQVLSDKNAILEARLAVMCKQEEVMKRKLNANL